MRTCVVDVRLGIWSSVGGDLWSCQCGRGMCEVCAVCVCVCTAAHRELGSVALGDGHVVWYTVAETRSFPETQQSKSYL